MKKKIGLLIILTVFLVAISGCLGGEAENKETPNVEYVTKTGGIWGPQNGHTEENEETIVDVNFEHQYISEVTFTLTWTDYNNNGDPEPAQDDRFTLEVTPPNGRSPQPVIP